VALTKIGPIMHRARGIVRLAGTLLTDASGNIAATSIGAAYGRIVAIEYDPGTLATGADITITDHLGAPIVVLTDAGTVKRRFRPTANITTNVGVAVTAATTATMTDRDIYIAGDVKVAVAQGGNAFTGTIAVIVDETPSGQV
jgi:hypothetical protein